LTAAAVFLPSQFLGLGFLGLAMFFVCLVFSLGLGDKSLRSGPVFLDGPTQPAGWILGLVGFGFKGEF